MSLDARLSKLTPVLTAQERALLVMQSLKDGWKARKSERAETLRGHFRRAG